jgi:hypothetical protein
VENTGTVLAQWFVLGAVLIACNRWMARRVPPLSRERDDA